MTIYVFGNPDENFDNAAVKIARKLKIPGINFKFISPNQDLPEEKNLVLLDVVEGLKKVRVFRDVRKIKLSPRATVHDFDLGMQLKYLQKVGKLKKVTIIGIPRDSRQVRMAQERLKVILRKLVAQDMQGS
jgi:hypothetical protein